MLTSSQDYGRGKIHLYGSAGDIGAVQQTMASMVVDLDREPLIKIETNAIYLPLRYIDPIFSSPRRIRGGLFTANGARDPFAPLVRGPNDLFVEETVSIPEKAIPIDGPVCFLGWCFDHYGHMIIEGMARGYAIRQAPKGTRWLIGSPGAWPMPTQQNRDLLDHFGVRAQDILDPQQSYRLRTIFVPQPAYLPRRFVTGSFGDAFSAVVHDILGSSQRPPSSSAPVFFSRLKVEPVGIRSVDELRLQELLECFGIVVLYPETLSVEEQIVLMNRHSTFIGLIGSAFHNKIWAIDPVRCLLMCPSVNGNYPLFDALKGGESYYGHVVSRNEAEASNLVRNNWVSLADWLRSVGILSPAQQGRIENLASTI